jgi:hypothetical protein
MPKSRTRTARVPRRKVPLPAPPGTADEEDVAPLTAAQRRELDRRIADSRDRSRYLLASVLSPRFVLYYDVAEDTFVWKDPRPATLFKRRAAAAAIAKVLGSGVEILPCRVNRAGALVLRSVSEALRTRRGGRARAV